MACVSDIDLATLHRNRLEERVHYKLSWWARRMISNTLSERHHTQRTVASDAISDRTLNGTNRRPPDDRPPNRNGLPPQSPAAAARGRHHTDRHRDLLRNSQNPETEFAIDTDQRIIETNKNGLRTFDNRFKDEDYFTTERRRRSGTWP